MGYLRPGHYTTCLDLIVGSKSFIGIGTTANPTLDINFLTDKGFFSKLLSTVSPRQTYQLIVKQLDESYSQVIFVDLSEEYEKDTIDYSFDFFTDFLEVFLYLILLCLS